MGTILCKVSVLTAGLMLVAAGSACGGDGNDSASSTAEETTTTATTAPPAGPVVGDRVETSKGNSVTVFSYDQPTPAPATVEPRSGMEFATVDAEFCLGPEDNGYAVRSDYFELLMPDDTQRLAVTGVREPALIKTDLEEEGDCVRGYVTFEVPVGERAAFVLGAGSQPPVRWVVT